MRSATGRICFRKTACPWIGFLPRCHLLAKSQSSDFAYAEPRLHSIKHSATEEWSGTGFCDDSVLHGPTPPSTMERVTLIALWSKSISPHFKPKISLCRKPVV